MPFETPALGGRRILLTGGTGFLGRTLLDYLIVAAADQRSRVDEVCVVSRDPERFLSAYPTYKSQSWLRLVQGDATVALNINGDFTDVLHASGDTHRNQDHALWISDIVAAAQQTLAFAKRCGAARYLLVSSGAVYGTQLQERVDELTLTAPDPMSPRSTYGQAKRIAEQLCTAYYHDHKIDVVIARCFAVIGQHMPLNGPYAAGNFVRDALIRQPIQVSGSPGTVRSFLDGLDLAHWLLTLLVRGEAGTAYNVGSDEAITIGAFATLVRDVLNPGGHVLMSNCASEFSSRYLPSVERARQLGLVRSISLVDAVRRAGDALAEPLTENG